jgi:hypothetical protein
MVQSGVSVDALGLSSFSEVCPMRTRLLLAALALGWPIAVVLLIALLVSTGYAGGNKPHMPKPGDMVQHWPRCPKMRVLVVTPTNGLLGNPKQLQMLAQEEKSGHVLSYTHHQPDSPFEQDFVVIVQQEPRTGPPFDPDETIYTVFEKPGE